MKNVLILLAVSLFALTVAAEEETQTTTPATPSNATEASTAPSATKTPAKETKNTCNDCAPSKTPCQCSTEAQNPSNSQTPKQD